MSHTKTLIGTITDKANASCTVPYAFRKDTDVWHKAWEQHWLATARQWRDELQAEGLAETVEALNKTIAFFEKVASDECI
jgi:hypothetical protein